MKICYREVLSVLERNGIEWYLTSINDSWNQIVARDNTDLPFSTWFTIEEGMVDVEDDFFEIWS